MKRSLFIFCLGFGLFSASVWADDTNTPPLGQITLRLSAERFVQSHDMELTVTVDATLQNQSVGALKDQIQKDLQTLARSNWRLTQIDRQEDASGLERFSIQAQTRVTDVRLGALRQAVKKLSHPGLQYTVARMDYTPSLADIESTRALVRQDLYQMAVQELNRFNKIETQTPFKLFSMQIIGEDEPQPTMAKVNPQGFVAANTMAMAAAPAPYFALSQKIRLNALVNFAYLMDKNA